MRNDLFSAEEQRVDPCRRRTWRIGFFVIVEVEARDAADAIIVAERATGYWQPRHVPDVSGELEGRPVVTRSVAMMAHPKENA